MTNEALKAKVSELARLQLERNEIALHLDIDPERLQDGGDLCRPWMRGLIQAKVEARIRLFEEATREGGTTQALIQYLRLCDRFPVEVDDA